MSFGTRRMTAIVTAFLSLLIALSAQTKPASSSDYGPSPGPYRVAAARGKLRDATRKKDIPFIVLYPEAAGSYPVIVFSHGAGGAKEGYTALTRYWASYGYVVIKPSHADALPAPAAGARHSAADREEVLEAIDDPQAWQDRAKDLSLVVDSLSSIEQQLPALKGKLNQEAVGAGGHSFGAFTAEAIGGLKVYLPGQSNPASFKNERVKAVLALSPQGAGVMGLKPDSWEDLNLPVMTMTGSRDFRSTTQGPDWRKQGYNHAPPGHKYHVFIQGAAHASFSGRLAPRKRTSDHSDAGPSGEQARIFDYIKIASLAFWDATLKKSQTAAEYLASQKLPLYSHGAVQLERK